MLLLNHFNEEQCEKKEIKRAFGFEVGLLGEKVHSEECDVYFLINKRFSLL